MNLFHLLLIVIGNIEKDCESLESEINEIDAKLRQHKEEDDAERKQLLFIFIQEYLNTTCGMKSSVIFEKYTKYISRTPPEPSA